MHDGETGAPLTWSALLERVGASDVVILGEQHDDAVGHAVQLAIVEDALNRWPGTALSLEMLERDEQALVDDYLEGIIDAAQLARLTFSERWGGDPWETTYGPIIDAARDAGSPVIAANAPRRYVRLARTDGYQRLEALGAERRDLFELPDELPGGRYRQRFAEVMGFDEALVEDADAEDMHFEAGDEHADDGVVSDDAGDDQRLESIFRAQLVWDATMAASIAGALDRGVPRVIHLVGRFHSDFDGGLVQELRRRRPDARILTVSLQPGEEPDDGDGKRADVVVSTDAPAQSH